VTVSDKLASMLELSVSETKRINVVPCATGSLIKEFNKSDLCRKLNIDESRKIVVYSGGYARYQHLEDLTLPFIKKLMEICDEIYFLVLTFKIDILSSLLNAADIDRSRVKLMSVDQKDVAKILSGCDLGLLIRKPTVVNQYAQPVKVGEYLAAGVPLCFHKGVSGVSELIKKMDAGIEVELDTLDGIQWEREAERVVEFLKESDHKKHNALSLASEYFLWDIQVKRQRKYYRKLIEKNK
jgi:hypothetical protein